MTGSQWQRHKEQWCSVCAYFGSKRKLCPLIETMDADPGTSRLAGIFSGSHCSQHKLKPTMGKAKI